MRRLGSRAGASDVKNHPFFKPITWALLRHMKPPMVPHQGHRAIDTVNFRNVKESNDTSGGCGGGGGANAAGGASTIVAATNNAFGGPGIQAPAASLKGVGLDSGLATPGGDLVEVADPFLDFNSVTLLHDGEEGTMAGVGVEKETRPG